MPNRCLNVLWLYRDRQAIVLSGFLAVLFLIISDATAAKHPCRYIEIAGGRLAKDAVVSLFQITSDNRRFKLGGLIIPGDEAAVSSLNTLSLHATNNKPDRYQRIDVQAFGEDDEWLQGMLLEQGRAFQYGLGQNRDCVAAMRNAESKARKTKAGLWASNPPAFEANDTDALLQQAGKFAIITGTVRSIGDRKRRVYLNFGSNWAEDMTAAVVKRGSGAYQGDVAVLQQLEGKRVEIRGIVEDAQGPLIRLIDEAQIDILDR